MILELLEIRGKVNKILVSKALKSGFILGIPLEIFVWLLTCANYVKTNLKQYLCVGKMSVVCLEFRVRN